MQKEAAEDQDFLIPHVQMSLKRQAGLRYGFFRPAAPRQRPAGKRGQHCATLTGVWEKQ